MSYLKTNYFTFLVVAKLFHLFLYLLVVSIGHSRAFWERERERDRDIVDIYDIFGTYSGGTKTT